jgi:hypothetical protein
VAVIALQELPIVFDLFCVAVIAPQELLIVFDLRWVAVIAPQELLIVFDLLCVAVIAPQELLDSAMGILDSITYNTDVIRQTFPSRNPPPPPLAITPRCLSCITNRTTGSGISNCRYNCNYQ